MTQNKTPPNLPGVYLFKKGRKILYIGKATNLRNRLKYYEIASPALACKGWVAMTKKESKFKTMLEMTTLAFAKSVKR